MLRRALLSLLLALFMVPWAASAQQVQETNYEGYLDAGTPSKTFTIRLQTGQSAVITTEATSGDLDTVLTVTNPSGVLIAENDDYSATTLDSAVGFTAFESGEFTVRVSRFEESDTSGNFTVNFRIGDESLLADLDETTRIQLSGPMMTRDTEHFRIHYTLQGADATTEAYVNALARSVEEIWRIQIGRMGWPAPPTDGARGGNALYDIYLADLIGQGEHALGYASPENYAGDNPLTPDVIENGASSYVVLENDFDMSLREIEKATSLMRATMSHEFNHMIQFTYDVNDADWYYEATATWLETTALSKDEDASGYVEYVYEYPELCFGGRWDETDGLSVYGSWLFMQALADAHGPDAVIGLWEQIAEYDDFEALEQLLAKYGDTLASMLQNYHVQNLVRQYELAPLFHMTVWREDRLGSLGRWSHTGEGIQELGANYFEVALPPGSYYAGLVNDDGKLALWGIGIRGMEADAIGLGRGGNINTSGYDHYYLMVFNPAYDNNVEDCKYSTYAIDLSGNQGVLSPVYRTWDATHFEPLE